ncbi:hypothetical protein [Amycolatopsis jiangsuensis]|uniref:Uncharacterized protein n=1 Tax=Amycolatopsis jiangsuensis TaxID=1181879 RepID=A0A840IZA5_9PSEU|nr:hypothetical protein [Amycolatopsis jiangsuensis]MBB4686194.1 hypothetical protein [Amycolatopsis jiangsuensis]
MTVRVTEATPAFRSRLPWWAKPRTRKDREAVRPSPAAGSKTSPPSRS